MNEALTYQAYYTKSEPILNYMTGMLHFHPQDSILEPCGGDGVFVDKILEKSPSSNIFIYELNPVAVGNLRSKYKKDRNVFVKETDTLLDSEVVSCSHRFDKIIGNPPYGARNDEHKKAALNRLYADLYTKESYTLFLYACTRCLNENGELSFIVPDTFLSLHRHLAIRKFLLTNTQIRELALFPSSFFPGVNFGYANLCIITLVKSSDIDKNMRNSITIRTDFRTVEELENSHAGTTKRVSQKTVYEGVGSAFMFNSTDRLTELINDASVQKIGDIASCVTGFYSGNDKKYLHPIDESIKNAKKYTCASESQIKNTPLTEEEKTQGIDSLQNLVPIVKGGNIEYIKPNNWFMDWSTQAISEYRNSKKCRFQNSTFYFRKGIGIPMIRSSKLTGALIDGRLFDQSIVGVFPKDEAWTLYLLGFINSSICTDLINAINPSTNNSANYIKKIPFIKPDKGTRKKIELLVKSVIISLEKGDDVSNDKIEIDELFSKLYIEGIGMERKGSQRFSIKQLNFFDVLQQYPENIVENAPVAKLAKKQEPSVDMDKNVLISLVKKDNVERYIDQSAKIYYTGKKFPSTVALNKLYYFMPYIKRKGIRDLYLIKIARVGTRKEGQPDNDPNDFRLVFEIEFVKKLFEDYKPVELEIWHTFTDTTIKVVLEK